MSLEDIRFNMTKKHTMQKFEFAMSKNLVDEELIPYLKKYNLLENTYTTSSCIGRILVLGLGHDEKKTPEAFVGKWHRTVNLDEILECLQNDKFEELWLKQEPFILHVCVKDINFAKKILEAKKIGGIKRGGIINIKDGRIIIEIVGSSYLSVPIKMDQNILFDKTQLEILIKKANIKIKKNYEQMWNFLDILYNEMK